MSDLTYARIEVTCRHCKAKITSAMPDDEEFRILYRDGIKVHLSKVQAIIFRCAVSGYMRRDHLIFEVWASRGLEEPLSASNIISVSIIRMNKILALLHVRLCRVKGCKDKYEFIDLKTSDHFEMDISKTLSWGAYSN